MIEPIMQFFAHAHLLPRNPERTVALRKLLEAKDAAVRAKLFVLFLLGLAIASASQPGTCGAQDAPALGGVPAPRFDVEFSHSVTRHEPATKAAATFRAAAATSHCAGSACRGAGHAARKTAVSFRRGVRRVFFCRR